MTKPSVAACCDLVETRSILCENGIYPKGFRPSTGAKLQALASQAKVAVTEQEFALEFL